MDFWILKLLMTGLQRWKKFLDDLVRSFYFKDEGTGTQRWGNSLWSYNWLFADKAATQVSPFLPSFFQIYQWVIGYLLKNHKLFSLNNFFFLTDLRERERKERKRNIDMRETSISCLPYSTCPGIKTSTRVCALTGNETNHLSVCGTTFQLTEPHQPGQNFFSLKTCFWIYFRKIILLCFTLSFIQYLKMEIFLFATYFHTSWKFNANACYMQCHLISSDSQWLCEWVMSTTSCPQQPCSALVGSCLWLLLWSQSIP